MFIMYIYICIYIHMHIMYIYIYIACVPTCNRTHVCEGTKLIREHVCTEYDRIFNFSTDLEHQMAGCFVIIE